jgi:protein translocase SecG subunit
MVSGIIIGFIVLLIVISALIIASILLQEDKSGGGIGILGGSSQSFFGVSSGNFLAKITSILLTIFLIACVVIAIIASRSSTDTRVTKKDIKELELQNITEVDLNDILTADETTDTEESEQVEE